METKNTSILSHLVTRFSSHPENLATEGLGYILARSNVARDTLIRFAAQAGTRLPTELHFKTQNWGEDGSIPDLVGISSDFREVLIIEAKFWAGLTEHQPVTYIERLPPDEPGIVMVIAPAQRLNTLWAELLRRCKNVGMKAEEILARTEVRVASVGGLHQLFLASWSSLLGMMRDDLRVAGEQSVSNDVNQLLALCQRMDSEAFLPIVPEELSPGLPRRIYQYTILIDELVQVMLAKGWANKEGLKTGSSAGYYGRYLQMPGVAVFLEVDVRKWGTCRETPFWLRIYGDKFNHDWSTVRRVLGHLEHEVPSRLLKDEKNDCLVVPLFPPANVEKEEVIASLLKQIEEVRDLFEKG